MTRRVAIERTGGAGYPGGPPYYADRGHPELRGSARSDRNEVFEALRRLFIDLELDAPHLETPAWNPLGGTVRPGNTVFIKPNMVDHEHRFHGDRWSVVTHPSVVWAVAEYVAIALGGRGRIIVGDNPHVDCHFEELAARYAPDLLGDYISSAYGVELALVDLRRWHVPDLTHYGFELGREPLAGDRHGSVEVDLGDRSLLRDLPWWLFRGTYHERLDTIRAHLGGHHRYSFSRSIFDADVLVSVPKLKSHAKVGATLNIKGLIGCVADKNQLLHWRIGYPAFGGDEYPPPNRISDYARLYAQHLISALTPSYVYFHVRKRFMHTELGTAYRRILQSEEQRLRMLRGAWEGNDTTWRMAVDVYRALVANVTGLRGEMRFFSIVDGIVGGDTDGPHFPDRRDADVLLAGDDFLAVDLVALRLMDYRLETVRYLAHLAAEREDDALDVRSTTYPVADFFDYGRRHLEFKPPHRWSTLSLGALPPGPSYLPTR